MTPALPKIEIWAYLTIWISTGIYSVFEVYRNSRVFKKSKTWYNNVDGTDTEWMNLSEFIIGSLFPACMIHLVISKTWRHLFHSYLMFEINLILSTLFYVYVLGPNPIVFIYIVGLSFYLVSFSKSWALIWGLAGFWRYFVKSKVGGPLGLLWDSTYTDLFRFYIFFAWLILKGIIYSMDVAWGRFDALEKNEGEGNAVSFIRGYIRLMAYFLYIPSMLGSPIIMYKSFYEAMNKEYQPWTAIRLEKFIISVLRYLFWWGISEAIIRIFFFAKMSRKPEYLSTANPLLLSGIAYSCGQFFMLKYVVFYGIVRPFALEDGVDCPEHPKCIARIHSYSKMWRHFDRGLYYFIRDYIYRPIMTNKGRDSFLWKLVSSLISFVFVFFYHGKYKVILVWSLLNFIAVSLESFGRWISRTEKYRKFRDAYLSPRAERRLYCLVITPLLLFSFLSNFYFFMGLSSGNMYFHRIQALSLKEMATLFFVLYSAAQGSIEIERHDVFQLKDR